MEIIALEERLKIKIKKNKKVIGIDTASRTGWCILDTNNKELNIDYGIINVDTKNKYFKYNEIINAFFNLITSNHKVIIEDTFFKFNPAMFKLISRIGAIAYTIAYLKGCNVNYLLATTARKQLGFKGNQKKSIFHKKFIQQTKFKLKDKDIIDALILALNGICK